MKHFARLSFVCLMMALALPASAQQEMLENFQAFTICADRPSCTEIWSGLAIIVAHPRSFRWDPRPDITPYELALAMPLLSSMPLYRDVGDLVDKLAPEVRRHFVETTGER